MESPWVQDNGLLMTDVSVWSADSEKKFDYSDGQAAEQALRDILVHAKDRSSLSVELDIAASDWVTRYHLGSERANLYRFLDLTGIKQCLELGCGCGAISRYLGEQGFFLDAVEGNFQRAEIAALRCAGLNNVAIIHSDFNHSRVPKKRYDLVLLNGVLEYAGKFFPGTVTSDTAARQVLRLAVSALKPSGVLCLAIENRMGLKYWLGAKEDHYNEVYRGIYGYPLEDEIRTWDRQELNTLFSSLSGYHYRYIYPFPDYKMPRAILTDDYVQNNPDCYSHLYRILSQDNGQPLRANANEFLTWMGLRSSEKFTDFANSFFVLFSRDKESINAIAPYDFAHFSGLGRKPCYRVMTRKKRDVPEVAKKQLIPTRSDNQDILYHNLKPGPFVQGPLLATTWLIHCLVRNFAEFRNDIDKYYEYLCAYFREHDQPEYGFDLLPFNIVVNEEGEYRFIDQEWGYHADITPEYILFRALLWFPCNSQNVLNPLVSEFGLSTVKDFIHFGFESTGLSLSEKDLDRFISLEEHFQSCVELQQRTDPVRRMLEEPLFASEISDRGPNVFLAQLYWQDDEGTFDEKRSVYVPGRLGTKKQTLCFQLPAGGSVPKLLRFDPADRPGFFHVFELRLLSVDRGGEVTELWKITGGEEIAKQASLENMYYCHGAVGESFFSVSVDPAMIFAIPSQVRNRLQGKTLQVEVDIDWPKSPDYLVVMDGLGHEIVKKQLLLDQKTIHIEQLEKHNKTQADRIYSNAVVLQEKEAQLLAKEEHIQFLNRSVEEMNRSIEKLKEQFADQLVAKDQHIESLATELTVLKGTRAWRMAEFFRQSVYYRLRSGIQLGKKGIHTLRTEGMRAFLHKSKRTILENSQVMTLGLVKSDYDKWVELNRLGDEDKKFIREKIHKLKRKPLISIIVPVYNVDGIWLEKTIASVQAQLYENWELCLVDDASPAPHIAEILTRYARDDERIKVLLKTENEGIALTSNAALSLATGEYVGLLDHDDELSIDALYENVLIMNKYPEVGLIYSDEDKIDMQGRRVDPFFKPDYSPDLLYSQNYICHFTIMKKTIVDKVGGFRKGYDGSQDHDIILRVIEKSERVCHIPKILYHWRKIPGSTAAVYDSKSYAWEAGRLAVEDALQRRRIAGSVSFGKYQGSYRVRRDIVDRPQVSIIIPFKDRPDLLRRCLDSILTKTEYEQFEILGISNNSTDPEIFALMSSYEKKDPRIRFKEYNVPFNFPDICNYGVDEAQGKYILLLNNDTEIISDAWLESLLEHAQRPEVGAVGGKLYYPDDRIQHAGIVVGMVGPAGHPHKFFHRDDVGYYARAHVIHNVSAVTGACLMTAKKKYLEVDGMDSCHLAVAYNDIDFCLKLLKKGYLNVFTPYCEAYHYESVTRGYDDTPEKKARLERETACFVDRWQDFLKQGDPWYNPNLSLKKENFSIHLPC